MTTEEELRESFYNEIDDLDRSHGIKLVKNIKTGRIYVKKTLPYSCTAICRMLMDEALGGIPKVVEIFSDDAEKTITVIEEYISGNTLATYLQSGKVFSEANTVSLASSLCDILAPLHTHVPPFIHRDIKPSNIMIRDDGEVVLLDFDATKKYAPGMSRDTELIGTPEYAAPEQYGFAQSSPRTDIYAIGVVMREMLTGSVEKCQPSKLGSLADIIEKCTAIDPDNRYSSVVELKRDLLGSKAPNVIRPSKIPNEKKAVKHVDTVSSGVIDTDRSWLPPGFRTGKPWKMVVAVLTYAFLIYKVATMSDFHTGLASVAYRITFGLILFLIILFFCDYRGIKKRLPLMQSENSVIRGFGYILYPVLIFFVVALLYSMVEMELRRIL